jgi:hypothetical protein
LADRFHLLLRPSPKPNIFLLASNKIDPSNWQIKGVAFWRSISMIMVDVTMSMYGWTKSMKCALLLHSHLHLLILITVVTT